MNSITCEERQITPSKVVCVGRNYVSHIQELGNTVPDELVVFVKPNSAIGNVLHAQHGGETLHYEAELAFLVESGQLSAVALGLDLTKRSLQTMLKDKGLPWERAKAFDGSVLFSPFVPLPPRIEDLNLALHVNDQPRQHGGVALMLHQPADALRDITRFMHFEDGDILMTGTPAGVGAVQTGEIFCGSVCNGRVPLISASWTVV